MANSFWLMGSFLLILVTFHLLEQINKFLGLTLLDSPEIIIYFLTDSKYFKVTYNSGVVMVILNVAARQQNGRTW